MSNPVLGRAIPSLRSLSTKELKQYAIHQKKIARPVEPGALPASSRFLAVHGGSAHRIQRCGENLAVIPLASHTPEGERH